MDIHKVNLRRFAGGRIEVLNEGKQYFYKGEIRSVRLEGSGVMENLVVDLVWMVRNSLRSSWPEGTSPPLSEHWVEDTNLRYGASLAIFSVSDAGGGRIHLVSTAGGDEATLFPRGSRRPVRPMTGK